MVSRPCALFPDRLTSLGVKRDNSSPEIMYQVDIRFEPDFASGYPDTISGYPDTKSGYPDTRSGYPDTKSGYPDFVSGYPDFVSGYPDFVSGYPDLSSAPNLISIGYVIFGLEWSLSSPREVSPSGKSAHGLGTIDAGSQEEPMSDGVI